MNEIPTYNHSKPDPESEALPSLYHYAATISIVAPLVSFAFLKSLAYGFKDIKPPAGLLIIAVLGFLLAFIYLVSLVFAIIALTGMSRYGKERIFGRSLAGMIVSIALLGIWSVGFVHGFRTHLQNQRAENELKQAETEMNADLKKQIAQKGTIDLDSGRQQAEKVKAAFDKASKEMTGDDALVAKAGAAYTAKMQALLANYTAAAQAIKSPSVLNMSSVWQRDESAARKERVNQFMDANEKIQSFFTKAENLFRDELVRVKLPPAAIEATLKGYRQTANDRNFLIVKIRMTDQRIGTALLGMLDTLDTSWGNWKYSPEKKNVIFHDKSVVAKYNEYFRDMNAAAKEQGALQAELVNLPATTSAQ